MSNPETIMFARFDPSHDPEHEERRLQALVESGLLENENLPVFEEATQTAAHFINAPICILGLVERDRQILRYAVGLSRLGLMNDLAASRQLPRQEAFCDPVIQRRRALSIDNATLDATYKEGLLVQKYGIQSYLGVPLLNSEGLCLGTLAVMDLMPRSFTPQDVAFLEMMARWSISEYERDRLIKHRSAPLPSSTAIAPSKPDAKPLPSASPAVESSSSPPSTQRTADAIRTDLLVQMTHDLTTPLTSIMGMTSVLQRGIYGTLTSKQKEYLDVVYTSGQYLLTLVNEILELGNLGDRDRHLDLASVDMEMLGQQALQPLEGLAQQRNITIRLSVEPGHRLWLLDKDKVRQMLYHLVFGLLQSTATDSSIDVHIARKADKMTILIGASHPWLDDGLQNWSAVRSASTTDATSTLDKPKDQANRSTLSTSSNRMESIHLIDSSDRSLLTRQSLGLELSQHLAELHGGELLLQMMDSSPCYIIVLPELSSPKPA